MIIIKLIGGLGNQMFQYATGKKVGLKYDAVLKFDIGGLRNNSGITPRNYALGFFNIQENFANEKEIEKLKGNAGGKIFHIMQKLGIWKKKRFIVEPKFSFNPEVLDIGDDSYLQGYWQTEKYFKDIEGVIRKEFTLKKEFSIEEKEMTKEIKNTNAISLHIRRGDYIAHAETNKFHGICSLDYYEKAIKQVAEKTENPVFFIFSDDIEWVKQNLKIDFPTIYVSDGILKDYEELMLMSYCKHNIIANSSFSWWGAWLNANPNKIVIAPKQWFAEKSVGTSDIIPETWTRI